MGALNKAGFPHVEELDLAKLLRPQSSDAALEDMAKACAGFEGASQPINPPSLVWMGNILTCAPPTSLFGPLRRLRSTCHRHGARPWHLPRPKTCSPQGSQAERARCCREMQ